MTGGAQLSKYPFQGQWMPPCALLEAMSGACVYWKVEFPPKGGVEGTPARKHLAEHQETGWAGSTLLEKFITLQSPSPHITGAFIITSSRGAHIRSMAFTFCIVPKPLL